MKRHQPEVDDFSYHRYEDLEHRDREIVKKLAKIIDADFDEDDLDFQQNIEKFLGKKTLDRITQMRTKELEKMADSPKSAEYEEFLDMQLNVFANAKLLRSSEFQHPVPTTITPEIQAVVSAAGATIHKMLLRLAVIPYSTALHKKMELLQNVANNIHEHSVNPHDLAIVVKMTENLVQLTHYKNPIWKPLKIALCAVVGAACIAIGLLGIVPSFGASIGLIAAGAALCLYAGVKSFTHFLPKARESLASNLSTILHHTNKLLLPLEQPAVKPVKHSKK